MKIALVALALLSGTIVPAAARNFAVPAKNPTMMFSLPDKWNPEEIDHGVEAFSSEKDVYVSIEYAEASGTEKLIDANYAWMKKNDIVIVAPEKKDFKLNGMDATVFVYTTKDEQGPTEVDFVLLPGGLNRLAMITVWGSKEEQAAHGAELDAIMGSVKVLP